MADRKISELVALTTPAAGDYLPIIDISEAAAVSKNKRITIEELLRGAPDGTAAAPSIAFESDGGNGLYLAATDTIGISTNGVSRATISTTAITSALPIALSGSTSGSVTLTPVAVAGTTTITLPATTGTVVTTGDSGTITSTMIANGTIVDADINASAAIAHSKLANITAGQVLLGNASNVPTSTALSGDITVNSSGVTAISSGVIVNADVNASAAIAGTKISPDFGSQNVTTTGTSTAASFIPSSSTAPTNGVYLPAANTVGISTAGSGRLFVDSVGNIGANVSPFAYAANARNLQINATGYSALTFGTTDGGTGEKYWRWIARTASPAKSLILQTLDDAGGGEVNAYTITRSGTAIDYQAWNTGGFERLRITSAGLVGIGTSSPGALLTLAASVPELRLVDSDNSLYGTITAPGGDIYIDADKSNGAGGSIIRFAVDDSEKARIDSSGRLGIGTTTVNSLLEVRGTTDGQNVLHLSNNAGAGDGQAENQIRVTCNGNTNWGNLDIQAYQTIFTQNGGEKARIDANGRLLVGTSSARTIATQSWAIQNEGTNFQNTAISTVRNSNDIYSSYFVFGKSRGTTVGSSVIVNNNDELGGILWAGADGSSINSFAARIDAIVDGTPGANDMPGRLVLSVTADGASTPTEALRITNDRVICYNQPAPASFAAAATLTVADLKTGIIQYTGAAATLTLPTGTLTEGGFSGVYTNMTFEWSLINTGSGTATLGAGTNHTIVGRDTTLINTSSRFATRRTAANTFVSYRIA